LSDLDICHWYGISCHNGGTVDSILLGSNNLSGKPPKELFELTNLKWLWLYSNPIDFSFNGIEQARQLTSLLLDSTGLKSLDGIGNAYQLTDLDVRYNNVSGTIPTEISSLANLETVSLSENNFSGDIPSFSNNRHLKTLRIGSNKFTGGLPSFSRHTKLRTIDLSNNMIQGSIPSDLLNAADTQEKIFIDLSSNRLDGIVPEELGRFDQMTLLLRNNLLTGISPELCEHEDWNDGDVGSFECDGLMCPPGTYSPLKGRETQGGSCIDCSAAKFYGQSECVDLLSVYASSSTVTSISWVASTSISILVSFMIYA